MTLPVRHIAAGEESAANWRQEAEANAARWGAAEARAEADRKHRASASKRKQTAEVRREAIRELLANPKNTKRQPSAGEIARRLEAKGHVNAKGKQATANAKIVENVFDEALGKNGLKFVVPKLNAKELPVTGVLVISNKIGQDPEKLELTITP